MGNPRRRSYAAMVGLGILLSRVAGLIRERTFAHYFGNSDSSDAFKAALKIPNFLQNLFGEGVLSASFIPVYASLISKDLDEESGKLAGTIASLLALITALLALIGVFATPFLIDLIAPGFHGEKRLLTIKLVQIFFPGTALLVMSAWCLGVLNSHRRFFLSYVAPVLWNAAIIFALLAYGGITEQSRLAVIAAWGLVIGSALQVGIQLPTALKLIKKFKFGLSIKMASVKTVVTNFFPVVISRGVVQLSAYIDNVLASLLPTGAVSALAYAQVIYLLPVSLFGMSVAAAQLPQMSSVQGTSAQIDDALNRQLNSNLRQIAFFIVPSALAFLILGDIIIGAIFQTGEFSHQNTLYVWTVLAGSTVGLLASTLGRAYSSTFYALRDTRTPLHYALIRVGLTTVLGYIFALKLPGLFHIATHWGTAGLTISAGISGWVEFLLLRRGINKRIGETGLALGFSAKLWISALLAAALAWGIKIFIGTKSPVLLAFLILVPYGLFYFSFTSFLKISEAKALFRRFKI